MNKKNQLSSPITVVIVDGDPCACEELRASLKACAGLSVVGEAHTVGEAQSLLSRVRPDVVFLANELPDGSGFSLMQSPFLRAHGSRIVVFTAHDDCILAALRNWADDVLLRPVDSDDLEGVVGRMALCRGRAPRQQGAARTGSTKFLLYTNSVDFAIVDKADIGYFQYHSVSRCWEAVVIGKAKPVRLRHSIRRSEILQLSDLYIQVHQRFIINIDFLLGVTDGRCCFRAPFGEATHVVVGRVYREKLLGRFRRL